MYMSGYTVFIYLLKKAMLFIRNSCTRLRELAALLPQPCPHVLFLQQGVQLCQRVQDLLRETNTKQMLKGHETIQNHTTVYKLTFLRRFNLFSYIISLLLNYTKKKKMLKIFHYNLRAKSGAKFSSCTMWIWLSFSLKCVGCSAANKQVDLQLYQRGVCLAFTESG